LRQFAADGAWMKRIALEYYHDVWIKLPAVALNAGLDGFASALRYYWSDGLFM